MPGWVNFKKKCVLHQQWRLLRHTPNSLSALLSSQVLWALGRLLTLGICYHVLGERSLFSLPALFPFHSTKQNKSHAFSCPFAKDVIVKHCPLKGILNKIVCQCEEGVVWNNGKRGHAFGFHHVLAVCPWAGFLPSLSPGFLTCVWRLKLVACVILLTHNASTT